MLKNGHFKENKLRIIYSISLCYENKIENIIYINLKISLYRYINKKNIELYNISLLIKSIE